jgi:hypothetical protein
VGHDNGFNASSPNAIIGLHQAVQSKKEAKAAAVVRAQKKAEGVAARALEKAEKAAARASAAAAKSDQLAQLQNKENPSRRGSKLASQPSTKEDMSSFLKIVDQVRQPLADI